MEKKKTQITNKAKDILKGQEKKKKSAVMWIGVDRIYQDLNNKKRFR